MYPARASTVTVPVKVGDANGAKWPGPPTATGTPKLLPTNNVLEPVPVLSLHANSPNKSEGGVAVAVECLIWIVFGIDCSSRGEIPLNQRQVTNLSTLSKEIKK
jgi:hypothetical protein